MTTPIFPSRPGAWQPKVFAAYIEPLVATVKALVERDQREALDWVNNDAVGRGEPSAELPDFRHILYARRESAWYDSKVARFPLLVIMPNRTVAPFNEATGYIAAEVNEIAAEVVIVGTDPDLLTLQIMRYVRAIDLMWRSASSADLSWNLTKGHFSAPASDVDSHTYTPIADAGATSYQHIASLLLTAQYSEG